MFQVENKKTAGIARNLGIDSIDANQAEHSIYCKNWMMTVRNWSKIKRNLLWNSNFTLLLIHQSLTNNLRPCPWRFPHMLPVESRSSANCFQPSHLVGKVCLKGRALSGQGPDYKTEDRRGAATHYTSSVNRHWRFTQALAKQINGGETRPIHLWDCVWQLPVWPSVCFSVLFISCVVTPLYRPYLASMK